MCLSLIHLEIPSEDCENLEKGLPTHFLLWHCSPNTGMSSSGVDELTDRLVAGRYGELRCLRALAVANKTRDQLERELNALNGGGAFSSASPGLTLEEQSGSSQPMRRVSEQAEVVSNEISSLNSSRRVSSMASTFRAALEAVVGRRPPDPLSTRALSDRPDTLASQASTNVRHGMGDPIPAAPAARRPADLEAEYDMVDVGELSVNEAVVAPDASRTESTQELGALRRHAAVDRRLRDSGFRARLERVLRARLRDPDQGEDAARRLRDNILQRRADREADRAPDFTRAPTGNVERTPVAGQDGLLVGASFELLLSIQRMLQQELTAALHRPLEALQEQSNNEREHRETNVATAVPHTVAAQSSQGLGACVVCCEAEVNTVFYKCGHLCTCARCAHSLRSRRASCPICRAPIREVIQAFVACAPTEQADLV